MTRIAFVILLLGFLNTVISETTIPNTGDQLQGFLFQFTTSTLVLPTVPSCPSPLTLTQGSPTNAGGPDAVAPYYKVILAHEQLVDGNDQHYERMYSHTINVGSLASLQTVPHPFANGTQFIACIWASNGVSGGCQDLMTVSETSLTAAAYSNASSRCRSNYIGSWVTPPGQTLNVDLLGVSGTVASNGWPAACSDLKFIPRNGYAPFTLVIAPAFHPPVNISSNTTRASDYSMNYTIRLTHGQAFMAAVYDSRGNSWAVGPLHAGASDDLSCLQVATGQAWTEPTTPENNGIPVGALAGSVVGAFVVGALGALVISWFMFLRKPRRVGPYSLAATRDELDPYTNPIPQISRNESMYLKAPTPFSGPESPPLTNDWETPENDLNHDPQRAYRESMGLGDFHPVVQPGSSAPSQRSHESYHSAQGGAIAGGGGSGGSSSGFAGVGAGSPRKGARGSGGVIARAPLPEGEGEGRNVYVVHSDGGGGNVTIRLPEGVSNVVELPPQYRNELAALGAGSSPTPQRQQGHSSSPTGADPTISLDHQLSVPFLEAAVPPREGDVSRGSGVSGITEDELRARAEAARGEKAGRH